MPMPVRFIETELDGVLVVESGRAADDRGFFSEVYSERTWAEQGFRERFVQDNLSMSHKGVVRGMHYQLEPHAMGKLVRAVRGAVYDVAVDLRRGSPTFGKWVGVELNESGNTALWIPAGFAHGFLALEDHTLVYYKSTAVHTPEAERTLSYQCPRVGICWPIPPKIISRKDAEAPGLDEAEFNFRYRG